MLTTVVSALKVIRIEAYTKVWEEDLINCCLQGRFCSHCSHHKLFPILYVCLYLIYLERKNKNKQTPKQQKHYWANKDFCTQGLQHFPTCCTPWHHLLLFSFSAPRGTRGFHTNWIPFAPYSGNSFLGIFFLLFSFPFH